MKITKTFMENFDSKEYINKKIKECNADEKVTLKGVLNIESKTTKKGLPYYSLSIKDKSGKIFTAIWNNNPIFDFLNVETDQNKNVEVNGSIYTGSYKNINIDNITFLEEENETEEDDVYLNLQQLENEFEKRLSLILNEQFKNVLKYVFDEETLEKFKTVPSSEKTAYNYKGGLLHSVIDSCDIVNSISDSINCGFWNNSTILNEELLLMGAILGNIGKTVTLQINDKGIISKTLKGTLDEDSIYSRQIVEKAIDKVLNDIKNEEIDLEDESAVTLKNEKLAHYENVFMELLHMIASIKNNVNWGALSTPRSKHAIILSHINNIVYTKGLFETLEKNRNNSLFSKPYDNGKSYYLGEYKEEE